MKEQIYYLIVVTDTKNKGQSPRLWWWENRLKLLAIVALIYDFWLSLLAKHFHKTLEFIIGVQKNK